MALIHAYKALIHACMVMIHGGQVCATAAVLAALYQVAALCKQATNHRLRFHHCSLRWTEVESEQWLAVYTGGTAGVSY